MILSPQVKLSPPADSQQQPGEPADRKSPGPVQNQWRCWFSSSVFIQIKLQDVTSVSCRATLAVSNCLQSLC